MSADIKNLRTRIRSVDSTLHLTKAMGLVASSKIRRANDAMAKSKGYLEAIEKIVAQLALSPDCAKSPYFSKTGSNRTRLVVIAGDRGLCGGYNANIFRLMRKYPDADVIAIGKRAKDRFKEEYISSESFSLKQGYELAVRLLKEFSSGGFDRLGIVSTKYISIMAQEAQLQWVLPIERQAAENSVSVLFEPCELEILDTAVLEYLVGIIMASVREGFACEVASRRMAMDSARKNAEEMISELQLSYNRARQGAITQEITEIVAGSGI